MTEFTEDEMTIARSILASTGIETRDDCASLLHYVGLALIIAADQHPDDASVHMAAALFRAWRKLPWAVSPPADVVDEQQRATVHLYERSADPDATDQPTPVPAGVAGEHEGATYPRTTGGDR